MHLVRHHEPSHSKVYANLMQCGFSVRFTHICVHFWHVCRYDFSSWQPLSRGLAFPASLMAVLIIIWFFDSSNVGIIRIAFPLRDFLRFPCLHFQ